MCSDYTTATSPLSLSTSRFGFKPKMRRTRQHSGQKSPLATIITTTNHHHHHPPSLLSPPLLLPPLSPTAFTTTRNTATPCAVRAPRAAHNHPRVTDIADTVPIFDTVHRNFSFSTSVQKNVDARQGAEGQNASDTIYRKFDISMYRIVTLRYDVSNFDVSILRYIEVRYFIFRHIDVRSSYFDTSKFNIA